MHRKLRQNRFFAFLSFFILFLFHSSFAQNTANPFDIGKPEISLADSVSVVDDSKNNQAQSESDNPFDIVAQKEQPRNSTINISKTIELPLTQVQNNGKSQNFLFILVLVLLLLLTILVSISRNLITRIYQAFFNDVVLKMLFRERGSLSSSSYFLLYSMYVINFGVFIYLSLRHYGFLFYKSDFLTLIYCILGIGVLIASKHLVLGILSYIFPISKELDIYNFIILIFGILVGLILAPLNVFFAYSDASLANYIIIGTAGTVGIVYGLSALRSLFYVRSYIFPNFFHFLLYLCSVEIVPLLLLVKLINTKLQIPIL